MKSILALLTFITFSLFGEPLVIGIAGGSASGKTKLAGELKNIFNHRMVLVSQDCYYKDLAHLPLEERKKTNFDHPDSIDFDLLGKQILSLKQGESIRIPIYDFYTYTRSGINLLAPADIVVIEGTLIFAVPELFEQFDLKIFVDADADIRLLRRILRDTVERGRTVQQICEQYLETVKSMHDQYILPSKQYADFIFPSNSPNSSAIQSLVNEMLNRSNCK